ncbi:MAG: hypothetical protein ACI9H6_000602 [Patiriisocius sp.]|jgi:hypothetical protein
MSYILRISKEQNNLCYYCEHPMFRYRKQPLPSDALTKDHFIPRSEGGETSSENMVAACSQCNNLRGDIDAETFYNLMQKWFRKNPFLWIRWHNLSRDELYDLKLICARVHERRLRGKARHHLIYAYKHFAFVRREKRLLARIPA